MKKFTGESICVRKYISLSYSMNVLHNFVLENSNVLIMKKDCISVGQVVKYKARLSCPSYKNTPTFLRSVELL